MDEYISKQRAKDLMGCCLTSAKANYKAETSVFKKEQFKHYAETIEAMIDVVGAVEAADVQPVKHGRWVQYNRNGEETYIECTNCCVPSRPRHLQMVTRSGEGLPDYCPNCGARMIKDGDTE